MARKAGVSVTLNLTGLREFGKTISSRSREIRAMTKQWQLRYKTFTQRRFLAYSAGGGDWPPLSAERVRQKRQNSRAILIDFGALIGATKPTLQRQPGWRNVFNGKQFTLRLGFFGSGAHPSGAASIAQIALWHQTGRGNLPVREIIVAPDQATVNGMRDDANRALIKLDKRTDIVI